MSAIEGDGSGVSEKIWYHDQNAWPTLHPSMPTAMRRRHVRSTPVTRRDVHQQRVAAARPAPSWAASSTMTSPSSDSTPELSRNKTTRTTHAPTTSHVLSPVVPMLIFPKNRLRRRSLHRHPLTA